MPAVYLAKKVDQDAATVYNIKSNPPEFMTIDELACYLTMSTSNIYVLKRQGKIPFVKIGRRILFDRAEIRDWVRTKKTRS